ncbi:MAG: molybdopterin biosynthesis protein [Rhodospirillales bacterium]|nr:molybdopterin biosynthesis protein [Rhodospirillales bacterium]
MAGKFLVSSGGVHQYMSAFCRRRRATFHFASKVLSSNHPETARGAPARTSVAEAIAWIDAQVGLLGAEEIALAAAVGRVLAQDVVAAIDAPPFDRAAVDGIAVRAEETAGAGAYNPLRFDLVAAGGEALTANAGRRLGAGDALPAGADAVVPLEDVGQDPSGGCEIIDAVASGSGIERRGSQFVRGTTLLRAGRRLHPHDVGVLAVGGVAQVQAVRRPQVRCLLLTGADANLPLLPALVERDGGTAELVEIGRDRAAIGAALAAADADMIIIAGGTGLGRDDEAASALAECGEVAIRGVALLPGEAAGMGRNSGGVPVFLLPGAAPASLWAYEFLAGRAVRILAGGDPALPFRTRRMTIVRKLVSAIGTTEVFPVRWLSDDRVEPVAAAADGFVVVPEGSEGVRDGASVTVYLYAEGESRPIDTRGDEKP